jgi:hypothetical protein
LQLQPNNIINSLTFLQETINRRLQNFFQKENAEPFSYPELKFEPDNSPLHNFIVSHNLNLEAYFVLLLALAPHVQPNFLDAMIQQFLPGGGEFPEIGGVKGSNHRGTIPTGETALFLLAGTDLHARLRVSEYFSPVHFFST